jgi:hypothetical protein
MPKHESAALPMMPAAEYVNDKEQAEIARIRGLLEWGQKLNDTDKESYFYFLLRNQQRVKAVLDRVKADEMAFRVLAINVGFDTSRTGTQRVELEGGYQAKGVIKYHYGFVKTPEGKLDKRAIDAALTAIEERSPAGAYIAEHLVKWTPDLSLTEYKKLPAEDKAIIDEVIITTDAAPVLEIEAPKGSN